MNRTYLEKTYADAQAAADAAWAVRNYSERNALDAWAALAAAHAAWAAMNAAVDACAKREEA